MYVWSRTFRPYAALDLIVFPIPYLAEIIEAGFDEVFRP